MSQEISEDKGNLGVSLRCHGLQQSAHLCVQYRARGVGSVVFLVAQTLTKPLTSGDQFVVEEENHILQGWQVAESGWYRQVIL